MSEIDTDPLRPVYPFVTPGEPVEVHRGDALAEGRTLRDVRIWASFRRDPDLRWEAGDEAGVDIETSTLEIMSSSYGRADVSVMVHHTRGSGSVAHTELGQGERLDRVIVHWVNVPFMHPVALLEANERRWLGRWRVRVGKWQLTLDARSDLHEVLDVMLSTDEEFLVTHVGEIVDLDGRCFTAEEATRVIVGWQLAMSVALGRWVAPALPVGFDGAGGRVWEVWARWRCDVMSGYQSWWTSNSADDLRDFVADFMTAYLDETRHPVVWLTSHHVVSANHAGTTPEARIMIAQAGIDFLAWNDFVLSGSLSRRAFEKVPSADHLRRLLENAAIPPTVPAELTAVHELASSENLDGPGTTSWVRNRLVHPKDPREPYRLEHLVWQTSLLVLEYLELLLLHRVGYTGHYAKRYPPGRWHGSNEPVPWAVMGDA